MKSYESVEMTQNRLFNVHGHNRISEILIFPNLQVVVFDKDGKQMREMQDDLINILEYYAKRAKEEE